MHNIDLPDRIAALERDERGYPIPFIVLRDKEGKPYFTANDILRVRQAVEQRLCHICGQPLEEAVWFTGGSGSALLNGDIGAYNEGPMHHECMRFAMQVCPHLSHHMTKAIGSKVAGSLNQKGVLTKNPTSIPGVPPLFVCVQTLRFKVEWAPSRLVPTATFLVPKPFRKTEYWQRGELLPLHEGRKAAKRAARELSKTGKL